MCSSNVYPPLGSIGGVLDTNSPQCFPTPTAQSLQKYHAANLIAELPLKKSEGYTFFPIWILVNWNISVQTQGQKDNLLCRFFLLDFHEEQYVCID